MIAVPPGETIKEWAEENGRSDADLEEILCLGSDEKLADLLSGAQPLTPELCLFLAAGTGIPMRLWLRLEADYRQALKEQDTA